MDTKASLIYLKDPPFEKKEEIIEYIEQACDIQVKRVAKRVHNDKSVFKLVFENSKDLDNFCTKLKGTEPNTVVIDDKPYEISRNAITVKEIEPSKIDKDDPIEEEDVKQRKNARKLRNERCFFRNFRC